MLVFKSLFTFLKGAAVPLEIILNEIPLMIFEMNFENLQPVLYNILQLQLDQGLAS
jgi:hypothetical protein